MTDGLILPGLPGRDPVGNIRRVLERHNLAMRTMTPEQQKAVNRIVLATLGANFMAGDAPAEVQRGAAQAALEEVIRREANGEDNQAVMWAKNVEVETTDQLIDRLAKTTRESR